MAILPRVVKTAKAAKGVVLSGNTSGFVEAEGTKRSAPQGSKIVFASIGSYPEVRDLWSFRKSPSEYITG